MIYLDIAAILKWAEEKRRPKSPVGWQGYDRMGTLDRIGEAESVATSGRIPDRTPDKFFRRLFSFRRRLKLRIAACFGFFMIYGILFQVKPPDG
jgi:hypothetical protein